MGKGPITFLSRCLLLFLLVFHSDVMSRGQGYQQDREEYTLAYVNVSYYDPVNRRLKWEREATVGKYGQGKIGAVEGVLVHVRSKGRKSNRNNNLTEKSRVVDVHSGCETIFADENIPKGGGGDGEEEEQWIGLIRKGHCSIAEKILNAANNNATAVIIYDDEIGPIQKMHHRVQNIVSILIARDKGERLAHLADSLSVNGSCCVRVSISIGARQTLRSTSVSKTTVLFVSVSISVLMLIALTWLAFYYIQRFRYRYINVKDQLATRLSSTAKKALKKIPLKTVKESEAESECCAICIESYYIDDVLRILPCSHQFHQSCVDPWLLHHRTCPCCKLDILKYFGLMQTPLRKEFDSEADEAAGRFRGNSADQRPPPPTSTRIQVGAGCSHLTAMNAYDQRCKALPRTPDLGSAHQAAAPAVAPAVETIKIAILENSPMARRNLRWADRACFYVTLESMEGPT